MQAVPRKGAYAPFPPPCTRSRLQPLCQKALLFDSLKKARPVSRSGSGTYGSDGSELDLLAVFAPLLELRDGGKQRIGRGVDGSLERVALAVQQRAAAMSTAKPTEMLPCAGRRCSYSKRTALKITPGRSQTAPARCIPGGASPAVRVRSAPRRPWRRGMR